VISVNNNTAWS